MRSGRIPDTFGTWSPRDLPMDWISSVRERKKRQTSPKVFGLSNCEHICSKSHSMGALAGVTQWIEQWPASPRVTGSIPSQDTCLGCGPGPQLGVPDMLPIHISLLLFLLLSLNVYK